MIASFGRYASAFLIVAFVFAGCGATQPQVAPTYGFSAAHELAQSLKQKNKGAGCFQNDRGCFFLTVPDENAAYTGEYPCCERYTKELGGVSHPTGVCGTGNVWVTSTSGEIHEYAHGGSEPIASLSGGTLGCAIDASSGDLAAVDGDTISVWANASGAPVSYTLSGATFQYCGFDSAGNLFVDGYSGSSKGNFVLAELPAGGTSLEQISLGTISIGTPGAVVWDGTYLALQDLHSPFYIYRVAVNGTSLTLEQTISFGQAELTRVGPFVMSVPGFDGNAMMAVRWAHGGHNSLYFFNYPSINPQGFKKLDLKGSLLGLALSERN